MKSFDQLFKEARKTEEYEVFGHVLKRLHYKIAERPESNHLDNGKSLSSARTEAECRGAIGERNTMTEPFKEYVCSYWHQGKQWSLNIHASGWADAEARCKKLGLTLNGELKAVIPAQAGWVARTFCWLANWAKGTQ